MKFTCPECYGEGKLYASRYGGNDPDVWVTGPCENPDCEGGLVEIDTSAIGKLRTEFKPLGFAGPKKWRSPRRFDWMATDDAWAGACPAPIGYGDSEVAAIRDLIEWIELELEDAAHVS